jgi:ankyrin
LPIPESNCIDGNAYLFNEIILSNLELVEAALKAYPGLLEVVDLNGNTPLCVSTQFGLVDMVSMLLRFGASLSAANCKGLTPLHLACKYGHDEMVLLLLRHNANAHAVSIHGDNPLHLACIKGHEKVCSILLHKTDLRDKRGKKGRTYLHCSSICHSIEVASLLFVLQRLDKNAVDDFGRTALHYAILANAYDFVKFLIDQNCDTFIKDNSGFSALHYAVQKAYFSIIQLLYETQATKLQYKFT